MSKIEILTDKITLRVNVKNTSNYDFELLNQNPPNAVESIWRSADPDRQDTKMLIEAYQGYKISEIRKWVKTGYSKIPFDYSD
jgi:hypothetical protein